MSIRIHAIVLSLLAGFTLSASAMDIPLTLEGNWRALSYRNIPANTFSQNGNGIRIDVNASASPLIFAFDQPQAIQQISVSGTMRDLPTIPGDLQQGDDGADDFPFRIGLVLEGDKTLNYAQKLIAPKWVKTLYDLAPSGTGVDHVLFLNLANPESVDWQMRDHPASKGLFKEKIVQHVEPNTDFEMRFTLPENTKVLALWISSDGDDTLSTYSLDLASISVN